MKTKTTATKKKAASSSKKKSTNKSQVARAMPVHVPTNATTLQLQQRLAYIQQLEQLDQSNAQLRQMMNAQLASQQQMGSNNRSTTGVVLPTSTPSQLQHLQQQVVAAQINQVNNRKDMIHQIDKEIRAKIPSVQDKKKKSSSSSEDKVEKVVIKAEQLFHLTVSPGRLGLTIAMNPNGGATITVIDPICTFSSKINVGDRIVTIDGKDVLTLEDIKNGKDRARTFGIMQKVKENNSTTKGQKEMDIAAKMAKNSKETTLTAAAALEVAEMSKDIVALSATQAEKKSLPVTQVDKKTADKSTAGTGKKKTKKQKDPNKPKGFKSAYNFCMADARPIVKAANPDLSFREMPKKLGEYWQALSKEERAPYEKMAAADKERYDREMAVYLAKKDGSGEAVAASKVESSGSQEGKKKRKREVVDTIDDKAFGTNDSMEVVEEGNANKRLKHEGFFTRVFNKIKGIFS